MVSGSFVGTVAAIYLYESSGLQAQAWWYGWRMKYVLTVLAMCLCLAGCSKDDKNTMPEFKTCVRCQETDIKFWADKCKHCGEDPDGPDGAAKRAEYRRIEKEAEEAAKSGGAAKGAVLPPPIDRQRGLPPMGSTSEAGVGGGDEGVGGSRAHNSDKNSTRP